MIIKKAKYKTVMVREKRRVEISAEVYGCDECGTALNLNGEDRLRTTVFMKEKSAYDLCFCSWGCVLKNLKKIKSDYFVSLPHVYFENNIASKRSAKELIRILSKLPTTLKNSKKQPTGEVSATDMREKWWLPIPKPRKPKNTIRQ